MKRALLAAALAAASLAAFAQPYGTGPGPGRGPGAGPRFGADVTPGWSMMTPEERQAHREKMQSMKDPAQCQAYMAEHQKQMQERAKERGKPFPGPGTGRACEGLKKPA
jgi:hypothetical protein